MKNTENKVATFEYNVGIEEGSVEVVEVFKEEQRLEKRLEQRHIQMIALVGVIGTGLFLSSGSSLQKAGPLGMLLSYLTIAIIVSLNQLAMAETAALMPSTASSIRQAQHFIDPAMSFAYGWLQMWSIIVPSELVATAVIVSYWTDLSSGIWLTVFIVLSVLSNCWSVRVYGELEFFFAILKILLILGLILAGLVLDLGGVPGQPRLGFHYWKDPGVFASFMKPGSAGKAIGFFSVLNSAVYSFGGVQNIAYLSGETKNPRRNIPKAAKRILYRVVSFYMITLFIMSLIVPYNDPRISNGSGNASGSPFVVAFEQAGIKALPSIVNAIVLTSAWSAANTGLVAGSRTLFSLANNGQAPKIFLRTNKRGLPWVGTIVTALFMPLSYMTLGSSSSIVFGYLVNVTSSILLINWILISAIHYRLNRALEVQGYSRSDLPFHIRGGKALGLISGISSSLLLLIGGFTIFIKWDTADFVSAYVTIPLFVGFFTFWKLFKKTKWIRYEDIDLKSLFQDVELNPEPPEEPLRGWKRLQFLWA
ncbi:proline permease PUT4 [Sugiyamaella lignohabitans]|uniref:Proline permease PUT4 n=1 Tax=Sugiyamaella lignohabitans TaxID=796027 RepID=A0A167C3J3_9ASCO|nr:proline permease PUT4 [Sugiyamaella lignohabitans]ANB11174.1 proline permease PUT4 [Sugiyamaella lignohabitans]